METLHILLVKKIRFGAIMLTKLFVNFFIVCNLTSVIHKGRRMVKKNTGKKYNQVGTVHKI